MELSYDYSKCKFDISKDGLLIDNYNILKNIEELKNPIYDGLLRFVIAISDKNSPIIEFGNWEEIVTEGYNDMRGLFVDFDNERLLGDLIACDIYSTMEQNNNEIVKWVLKALVRYHRLANPIAFVGWYNLVQNFYGIGLAMQNMGMEIKEEKQAAIRAKLDETYLKMIDNIERFKMAAFPNLTISEKIMQSSDEILNFGDAFVKDFYDI